MKHRPMIIFSLSIAVLCVILFVFISQPAFGRNPRGERLERIKQSPFYRDGQFQNEEPSALMTGKHSYLTSMRDMLTGRKRSPRLIPEPGEVPVVKSDLKHLPSDRDLYVWFGHSSFLLQLSGKTILVDPVLIQFSPVKFIGKIFPGTDVYKPEDMPQRIDYLVISHDHYDHLDYKTVKALRQQVSKVICPLGVGENFEHWGYSKEQIVELDCNEDYSSDGFTFHCLPTRHFSGRSIRRNTTQRASWLIDTPKRRVFYSGDGGFGKRFERFGQQFSDIDLAIMENGQYDVNWSQIHTLPSELGQEVCLLQPHRFVTVHHSKVALANHAWDEPRLNEQKAAAESGIPLIVCQIGEVVELDK